MYQNVCNCGGRTAVNGLGLVPELLTAASSLVGGGSGSGSGGAAPSNITVSPAISTQISPQISPVFQQQFQPSNSAATAGTSQSLPAMPSLPGTLPNGGVGVPGYSPAPPTVPPVQTDWARYMPYALAGVGILAFVTLKKRGPKKAA